MDSRKKSKNDYCLEIQKKIFELTEDGIPLDHDSLLEDHLNLCQNCQNYMKSLVYLKNSLQATPSENLYPDSRILRNIITFKAIKSGSKKRNDGSVWNMIRGIFEFKIPVYQALSAVAGILVLFMYISGDYFSKDSAVKLTEYAGTQKVITSSELYTLDSLLSMDSTRGQSAKEDSVLISFIVPTM